MNKSIVEKIKKLLALATSSNQHEAELASKRAQELLLKHNISMANVENAQFEFTEHKEDQTRMPVEAKFINSLLIEFFFLKIIQDRNENKLIFLGTPENIEVGLYVRSFLKATFKRLYKVEAKAQGWVSGRNRNAFYFGLFKGLKEQLLAQKVTAQATDSKALSVIDHALTKFMNNGHPRLRTAGHRRIGGSQDAIAAGTERGRKLRIAKGLGSQSASKGQALALGGGK